MSGDRESLFYARGEPRPEAACEKCSHGVMDDKNPHMWGECRCDCHGKGVLGPVAQAQMDWLFGVTRRV